MNEKQIMKEMKELTDKHIGNGMSKKKAAMLAAAEMLERYGSEKMIKSLGVASGKTPSGIESVCIGMSAGYKGGGPYDGLGEAYGGETYYQDMARKRKEFAEGNKARWIEKGKQLVYPEKLGNWIKMVEEAPESAFGGFDIEKALEIMTELDTKAEIGDVVEQFGKRTYNGGSTERIILNFSKRGPEYVEKLMESLEITNPEISAKIEELKAENMKLARKELERNRADKGKSACELTEAEKLYDNLSARGTQENPEQDPEQDVN